MRVRRAWAVLWAAGLVAVGAASQPGAAPPNERLEQIRQRGSLTCGGVWPGGAGFSQADPRGGYRGLDADICRALSAAIFGTPDKVQFVPALSVNEFRRSTNVDIVS